MAWQPGIPNPGDLLTQSQADLQDNFTALDTYISPNTPTLNMGTIAATPGQVANTMQVYTKNDGVHPQLYIQRELASADLPTEYAITQGWKLNPGWCWLPNGLLMWWGSRATAGTGSYPLPITVPASNPVFPGFTALLTVLLTAGAGAGAPNSHVYVNMDLTTNVNIQIESVQQATFVWAWAIGSR